MDKILKDIIGHSQDTMISILILSSCIDIVMGVIKALYFKRFNSEVSLRGILKHITAIILPILCHPLFMLISGGNIYYQVTVVTLIITMCSSILGSYASIGLPYPKILESFVDVNKYNDENEVSKKITDDICNSNYYSNKNNNKSDSIVTGDTRVNRNKNHKHKNKH